MTVSELIEKLEQVKDKSRILICQKDAEGNGYSPLHDIGEAAYRAETTWYGDVGLEWLTDEDREAGYTNEDVVDGVPALILVPVN